MATVEKIKIGAQLSDTVIVEIDDWFSELSTTVDLETGVWPRCVAVAFHDALARALKKSPDDLPPGPMDAISEALA